MPKVILICGKICSGKSTYAESLRKETKAILLSVDEITLALFDRSIGENHDEIVARTERYLFEKSLQIIESGHSVILDWGFWQKEERNFAKNFYKNHGINYEMHYTDISDEQWKRNIDKRNKLITEGKTSAYFVDENLANKFNKLFEIPSKDEIDVWF